MTRSIENFLTAEEQQLITDFINKIERNSETSERVMPEQLAHVRAQKERDKQKLIDLKQAKCIEWKKSINVQIPNTPNTYLSQVKNKEINCAIDKFFISFTELLRAEGLPGEERNLLETLKRDVKICGSCCPCPANSSTCETT